MNKNNSAEVAKKLGVSQRQARRLIAAKDPRLHDTTTPADIERRRRKTLAEACLTVWINLVLDQALRFKRSIEAESLQDPADLARIRALHQRLVDLGEEFKSLGDYLDAK